LIMKIDKYLILSILLSCIFWSVQVGDVLAVNKTADSIPWSGWWWPYAEGGLSTGIGYRGRPAPLEKYSMLHGMAEKNRIMQWYENRYYDSKAPYWYGICYAWAAAASFESEPRYPSSVDNIIFRVGDKKGLLTFAHLQDYIEHEDCENPAVLHYWLLHYIGEMRQSFVADLDSGDEVWSHPIYKYDMQITDVGQKSQVKVELHYADDFVKPDYVGIQDRTVIYEYELYKDSDGGIIDGHWLGDSIASHPDYLSSVVAAHCDYGDFDYQFVRELASSKDDYLESAESVAITPGSYNLILLNKDIYELGVAVGETIRLELSKSDDSDEDIKYFIYDADMHPVARGTLSQTDESAKIELTAINPPYHFVLTQENYNSANIYRLVYNRLNTGFQFTLPYFPKNGMWIGMAVTNFSDVTVEDVCLVGYDAAGIPVATLWGPEKIDGYNKKLIIVDDSHCFMEDWLQIERLHLLAANELAVVALSGVGDQALTEIGKPVLPSSHLVIPDTSSSMEHEFVHGGVCNNSQKTLEVDLKVYDSSGQVTAEKKSVAFAPGTRMKFDSSVFHRDLPSNGWIDVCLGESENSKYTGIGGYLSWRLGMAAADLMRGLPVTSTPLWLINLPAPRFWKTTIVLINVDDAKTVFHIEAGNSSEFIDIIVQPHQRIEFDMYDKFTGVAADKLKDLTFKISSVAPFCGYVNYQGDADYVSLPLLSENLLSSVLTVPHLAFSTDWWTGICVFNPHSDSIVIKIVPVDIDGHRLPEEIQEITISPGSRVIFSQMDFWDRKTAENFSFLLIESESNKTIGGFFIYGNQKNDGPLNSLAGSNM